MLSSELEHLQEVQETISAHISSYQLHCSNLFQSHLVLALVQCHCHIVQGMIFGDEALNRSVQLLRLCVHSVQPLRIIIKTVSATK